MKYFIFKHYGNDEFLKLLKTEKYASCHYEYGYHDGTKVTNNWKAFDNMEKDDVIFLVYGKIIYGFGYVVTPRQFDKIIPQHTCNFSKIFGKINKDTEERQEYENKYIRGKKGKKGWNGIVYFKDKYFYTNLHDDKNRYPERVDVDYYRATLDGIRYNIKKEDKKSGYASMTTVFEIKENKALEIAREILKDNNFKFEDKSMENYIELLKSNKNLILTGAPGTGKTYLAKNIASQIILNKYYDESVENDINFKEQCAFVQFHPSYDYTDFVEGLRPENDNGNIGFERKDGVFKAFCKKALKNLKDSEKDIATLNYDEIIKKYFLEFIENDIQSSIEKGGYGIKGLKGEEISPVVYVELKGNDRFNYKINSKQNNQYTNRENLNSLIECYKNIIIKNYDKITHKMLSEYTSGYTSSTYGILKAFYDNYNEKIEQEKNNITVQEVEKRDFVFIIDEINRGEISKIFGELFFSVDSGYRGEKGKVQTQYANLIEDGDEFKDGFYIPENVYIIGTMNDIDRSVESMDFAMRRRFAWKEIKAEDTQETILNDLENLKDETIKRMNNLNKVIRNKETNLSEAYCIGAAYFKKIKDYEGDFNKLWDNHLKGLLFEYTRGMQNQETILKELKSAYNPNNTDNKSNNQKENKNS